MNKTIALIMTAAVLSMTALTLMFMTNSSLADFNKDTKQTKDNQICQFQVNRYCNGEASISQIKKECLKYVEKKECSDSKTEKAWKKTIPTTS